MYLKKLDYQVDIQTFLPYLKDIKWNEDGRCAINKPTGHFLYDPYEFLPEWKDTEFEKLYNDIPYEVSELRLIRLAPGECYRSHSDIDDRIHLNLQASDQCYLINLNDQEMHKLETDGNFYQMDGSYLHTAVNFGSIDRIQLVMRIPLKKYSGEDFIAIKIIFKTIPYNLRYIVDQTISPLLNRYVKDGRLGSFECPIPTEYDLLIEPEALATIVHTLDRVNLDYDVVRI